MPRETVVERIWRLTDRSNGCWLWLAYKDKQGYARMGHRGRSALAHRVAYETFLGPVPEGLELDHLCRVRHCVNPDHLEAVDHRDNALRGVSFSAVNARKTRCPQGHPYDDANTVVMGRGRGRRCGLCRAEHEQNRKRKKETA